MTIDFALDWIRRKVAPDEPRGSDTAVIALAASVMGDPIDAQLLASILDMDLRQLLPCLDMGVAAELLHAPRSGAAGTYQVADAEALAAAHHDMPFATRAALHQRAAEYLKSASVPSTSDQAARIATHHVAAAMWDQAFQSWLLATERAIEEAQGVLAVAHLERALAICRTHPGAISRLSELSALSLLGPLVAQLNGSGADAVIGVYARCLEITDELPDVDQSAHFDILWGLNASILVHGRIETAREMGARLLSSARGAEDVTKILLATRLQGLGSLLAGEIGQAIGNFNTVEQLYDAKHHAPLRFRYASDQAAVAFAHKAWAQAIAGEFDASERTSEAALDLARLLRHAHTSAHVTCVLAARAQTLRMRDRAAPLAFAGLTLARQFGFAYWEAWAEIVLGWHDGEGDPDAGIARIATAIAAYRRTGAGQALPFAQLLVAGLHHAAGDRTAAVQASNAALDYSEAFGIRLFQSEILRTKAQAVARSRERSALLEAAIATARRQGARLFEVRASLVLQGKDNAASIALAG